MIKVGIKPNLEMEYLEQSSVNKLYATDTPIRMRHHFDLYHENDKEMGISPKFLVSSESHKDEQSMLRLLNGEISTYEQSQNLKGNFKKVKEKGKKKKKKVKTKTVKKKKIKNGK